MNFSSQHHESCLICNSKNFAGKLKLPPQPISNRFLKRTDGTQKLFPLTMAQCESCGMIQLLDYPAAEELKPMYDWITYREPEGHLDEMVELISKLPGLSKTSRIGGFSFKDHSTVERFQKLGFEKTYKFDPKADFQIADPRAGVETMQFVLNPSLAKEIISKRGKFHVIIVRHVLEHAHSPKDFVAGLTELLAPGGYLVFEVPDCSGALSRLDYTTIWEEHTLYLTPASVQEALTRFGLSVNKFAVYPYAFENSLLAIAQKNNSKESPAPGPTDTLRVGEAFFAGFEEKTAKLKMLLSEWQTERGKIALFGAGHLSGSFVTLHELTPFIEFVVDDNKDKQNMFMPGSGLPILPSDKLMDNGISICLLGFNPELEEKVVRKFPEFTAGGGEFYSIFPGSNRRIPA